VSEKERVSEREWAQRGGEGNKKKDRWRDKERLNERVSESEKETLFIFSLLPQFLLRSIRG
jgi:hypothetical protein